MICDFIVMEACFFTKCLSFPADELDEAFAELSFLIKVYLGLEPPAASDSSQSKAGTGTVSGHMLLLAFISRVFLLICYEN